MKAALAALLLALAFGDSALAAERDGAFDKWLTPQSTECVQVSEIAKVEGVKIIDLTPDQFQFARALYVTLPPMSHAFPPGDRAIAATVGADVMVAIVDGETSCARFRAPDFVLQMMNDIKTGKVTHAGDPT
jgi:hypothetical protein